jgi:hypothetical protein
MGCREKQKKDRNRKFLQDSPPDEDLENKVLNGLSYCSAAFFSIQMDQCVGGVSIDKISAGRNDVNQIIVFSSNPPVV